MQGNGIVYLRESPQMQRVFVIAFTIVLSVALNGCGDPEPIKVGFIAGLSERTSGLGISARNGVQLAVDELNESGGIDGREIQLVVRDDRGTAEGGAKAAEELSELGVDAIIGPLSSAVARGVVPVVNSKRILTISPTVIAQEFVGQDDHFFRVGSTSAQYAREYAVNFFNAGYRSITVAFTGRNAAFTEPWLEEFRTELENLGGSIPLAVRFDASESAPYETIIKPIVDTDSDAALILSNGFDTAIIAQRIRQTGSEALLLATSWAATDELFELGGSAVEGLLLAETYDRNDDRARFVNFAEDYRRRFTGRPSQFAIASYDAAIALFSALSTADGTGDLKAALDTLGPIEGLQQQVTFDRFGDGRRVSTMVEVRQGQFRRK